MFSKWKDKYFEAKIEVTRLELQLEAVRHGRDSALAAKDEELARYRALSEEVMDLRVQKAILTERLDLIANHLPPEPQAFSFSEEEEEARWQLDKGLINTSQFESILAEAGAVNTEIHFDAEDYPRLSSVK